ncbi:hypothetical protein [Azonexus sp.]|uniref:hypothetical protein n=1 Tax=Azonexus sp. TaxID=1872668 RepID=UPI0027BA6932|nr:hypothetical protein [Azonexus sp.]
MKSIYVRVRPKSGLPSFFRCGMKFSQGWVRVEVDEAAKKRLDQEQMLEVSETKPAAFDDVPAGDSAATSTAAGSGTGTPADAPTDPAERLAAIRAAIAGLNKEDATLWTKGGKPTMEAVAAVTGWPVLAAERDAAQEGGK